MSQTAREELFRVIAASIPALVSYIGADYRYRWANRTYERWVHRHPDEIVGRLVSEVLGEDAWKAVRPHMERAVAGAVVEYEAKLPYRGGGPRWVRVHYTPHRADDGTVRGFVVLVNDISDQKRAEQRIAALTGDLRARVEELEQLLQLLPVGIFIARDAACREIAMNRAGAALLGLPLDVNPSKTGPDGPRLPFRILRNGAEVPPDELPMQRAAREDVRIDGEDLDIVRADGSTVPVWLFAAPLHDATGQVRGALGAFVDMTERERLERELRARVEELHGEHRRKDEFLAMLAHELRNPLAPIQNVAALLGRDASLDPTLARLRGILERQLAQLTRLVDDLLDVSRISRGKIELRRVRTDLVDVVNLAVETVRPVIDGLGHHLAVAVPGVRLWVDADPVRLAQVVANLLHNAAKYTDRGGHLGLAIEREGDRAVVRVRDDGIGIAAESLDRVFDLFSQFHEGTRRSDGGLGIGLTLVRRLVEMHGGSVEARSDGPGRGAEFTVRLPLAAGPDEAVAGDAPTAGDGALRVLVADDNVDAAETLGDLLRQSGHHVCVVFDGETALADADRHVHDAVILDLGMPGLTGYEIARRLRERRDGRGGLLVALTGWGEADARRRSRDAGFDRHLVKPVQPASLDEVLAIAGERRRPAS